jgi:thiamine kinase-like enzyme
VSPEEMASRVWPGLAFELKPLEGGITNRNFKVVVGNERFVLRVGGKNTDLLGIDRAHEHSASLAAADAGVGPEVVHFVEPEGWLVTRFVEGIPVPPSELERIADALRRFHQGGPIPGRFDSFRVVESYAAMALAHGVRLPAGYERTLELASSIERMRHGAPIKPCHNDLLSGNLIDDGERIRIVDWEYAGMGDPFFDLANFSVNHELDEEGDRALLRAYSGALRAEDFAAVSLMRFMSDFREAMWGVVQQAISDLDFDFRGYAEEHFERLERTAAEPRFGAALGRT